MCQTSPYPKNFSQIPKLFAKSADSLKRTLGEGRTLSNIGITTNLITHVKGLPSAANEFVTDLNQLAHDLKSGDIAAIEADYVLFSEAVLNTGESVLRRHLHLLRTPQPQRKATPRLMLPAQVPRARLLRSTCRLESVNIPHSRLESPRIMPIANFIGNGWGLRHVQCRDEFQPPGGDGTVVLACGAADG